MKELCVVLLGESQKIVSDRSGMLFFFVNRMDAEVADIADFIARCNEGNGTSRLMTLLAADWTVYVLNIASCVESVGFEMR